MKKNIENYYEILDIVQTNDLNQIKQAYKKKIKQFHPDKNKGTDTTSMFLKIKKAYEILSDPKTKQEHDEKLDLFNRKFSIKRQSLIDALLNKEKASTEAKTNINNIYHTEPNINKTENESGSKKNTFTKHKRERDKDSDLFFSFTKSYCAPKKKFCLKISSKDDIRIEFSKNTVKEYFSDFGIIDEIFMDSKKRFSFLTYKYESLFDISVEKIRKDNKINKLFLVEKELYEHIKDEDILNSNEEFSSGDKGDYEDIANEIKNQKICNMMNEDKKIDFNNIDLESFENEIFK